jgi:ribonuclease P protein component
VERRSRQALDAKLRSRGDFDAVFQEGVRVHGDRLILVGRRGPGSLRFAVTCGKRFSKRAVDRNRFRRVAREAVRRNLDVLPAGIEFVVLPRCRPAGVEYQVFSAEIPKLAELLSRRLQAKT